VQQGAGRVAVLAGDGAPVNADPELEAEAKRSGPRGAWLSAIHPA
jgi:phosphoserine phosphatase